MLQEGPLVAKSYCHCKIFVRCRKSTFLDRFVFSVLVSSYVGSKLKSRQWTNSFPVSHLSFWSQLWGWNTVKLWPCLERLVLRWVMKKIWGTLAEQECVSLVKVLAKCHFCPLPLTALKKESQVFRGMNSTHIQVSWEIN